MAEKTDKGRIMIINNGVIEKITTMDDVRNMKPDQLSSLNGRRIIELGSYEHVPVLTLKRQDLNTAGLVQPVAKK